MRFCFSRVLKEEWAVNSEGMWKEGARCRTKDRERGTRGRERGTKDRETTEKGGGVNCGQSQMIKVRSSL